jgi:anti-sigma-K factor RskA
MDARSHEEIKALVGAYVLGAVPEDEQPTIRAHLLTCEECMAEADSYSSTTSDLALAVEPVELPAGFEDRVMAVIADERTASAPPRSALRARWFGWAFGVAVLLVAIGFGAAYVQTQSDLDRERRVVSALLRSDAGMELDGDGVAAMIPTREGSVFVAEGLADPPDGHTYQLWLIEGTDPVSAGTFDVREGRVVIEMDQSLEGFDGAAVTVEPAGGSPEPTTDPVVQTT